MHTADEDSLRWNLATRVAFRFFAIYFSLYILLTQMYYGLLIIPTPEFISSRLTKGMDWLVFEPVKKAVIAIGNRVFHTSIQVVPTGSGDTMYQYALAFCLAMTAIAGTLVWSVLDRKRERYDRVYRWFRILLRFALGTTMLSYGFAKAFPGQMPAPQLTRLLEPYGNFSPMGVLWYSIGASFPYERFVGIVEVAAGGLLFFSRTQLLGAFVTLAAVIQVFMLNMTYDVPVKLFSFHLVLMSLVLAAPYATRVAATMFSVKARSAASGVLQMLLGLWLLYAGMSGARESWHARQAAPKPDLYGIWTIERMTIDGVERAPLVTDHERWRRVVVQTDTFFTLWRMNDQPLTFASKYDAAAKTITLKAGTNDAGVLTFQRTASDQLVFDGKVEGRTVHMETKRFDHTQMTLLSRGFNWVQEFPFNR